MALPAYGSIGAELVAGTSTAANVPVPSGMAANEIALTFLYVETTQAVTPPSGHTAAFDSPVVVTGTQAHNLHVFWHRATGSESGTYDYTIAAGLAWRFGIALRFTGCVTSGDPFEVTASAIKTVTNSSITQAVSDTTTGTDRLWVWSASAFFERTLISAPSGFTERADVADGVAIAVDTKDQAAAGASGSLTGTWSGNTASASWLGALKPVEAAAPATGNFFGLM